MAVETHSTSPRWWILERKHLAWRLNPRNREASVLGPIQKVKRKYQYTLEAINGEKKEGKEGEEEELFSYVLTLALYVCEIT